MKDGLILKRDKLKYFGGTKLYHYIFVQLEQENHL
jgi:hypothetical protein